MSLEWSATSGLQPELTISSFQLDAQSPNSPSLETEIAASLCVKMYSLISALSIDILDAPVPHRRHPARFGVDPNGIFEDNKETSTN